MLKVLTKSHNNFVGMLFHVAMGLRYSRNSYGFALKKLDIWSQRNEHYNEPVFKKKERIENIEMQGNKVLSQQDKQWLDELKQLKSIQEFIPYSRVVFSKQSWHLAQFLHRLYKFVDGQALKKHRDFVVQVGKGLNSFSGTSQMNAEQYIEMLRFHAKIRELGKQMNFLHNYGFEKKAHIIGATYIYNKKFTFNQATLVLKLLVPLGGITILFYTNFIKYFKATISDEAQVKTIGIVNILTLLQVQFAKRNEMIIEHILFDHVLRFLLTNFTSLLKNQSLSIKVDTLCTLLCVDSRYHYHSDANMKKHWISHLLREITQKIDNAWVLQICNTAKDEKAQPSAISLNLTQIIHLVQCMAFTKQNMRQYQCFHIQFANILNKIISIFDEEINKQSFKIVNAQQFIRLMFNSQIVNLWIKKKLIREKIFQFIVNLQVTDQQQITPFSNIICSKPQEYEGVLLQLGKEIIVKHLKRNVVLKHLIIAYIKSVTPQVGLDFIKSNKLAELSDENNKYFGAFILRLLQQNSVLGLKGKEISYFLKETYFNAIDYHIPQGYRSALSLIQQHFSQIASLLRSNDSPNLKQSGINPLLSEESFYFAWIVFNNIMNGGTVSNEILLFYQRLIKNDIIKYEILSHSYKHTFPHPKKAQKMQTINNDFAKTMGNIIKYFETQQKYAYFIWDIFMKRYTVQPAKIRQQCFDMMQQCFMNAYKKQKLRKVVMVNVFTNYIASGVIIGSRLKLKALFESVIDELLSSEDLIEYHYNCYLQIVFNAISADILQPIYFDKIIVYSTNKEKSMKSTCSLMLMYGARLKSRNENGGVVDKSIIDYQTSYLLFLIKSGFIRQPQFIESKKEQGVVKQRKYIQITSKLVSILFEFGMCQILTIEKDIILFLQTHYDYGEWRCMVNCYTPENYSMSIRKQALFRGAINKIMIDKLIFFQKMELISRSEQSYFIKKFK